MRIEDYPLLLRRGDVKAVLGIGDRMLSHLVKQDLLPPVHRLGKGGLRWSRDQVVEFANGWADSERD